jgi:hypothetical protein
MNIFVVIALALAYVLIGIVFVAIDYRHSARTKDFDGAFFFALFFCVLFWIVIYPIDWLFKFFWRLFKLIAGIQQGKS